MPSPTCVRCSVSLTNDIISHEHVLPRWVVEEVHIPRVKYKHHHHDEKKNEDELVRGHDLAGLAIKNLCIPFTNGWMSCLEARAKPTPLGLIDMDISLSQPIAEMLHRGSSSIKARDSLGPRITGFLSKAIAGESPSPRSSRAQIYNFII